MFTTDKVSLGYLPTYQCIAALIGSLGRVCEIGVLDGKSLDLWLHFFPYGLVVGVDHDEAATWPEGSHRVVCEQDDPALPDLLKKISPRFDLIVDDASHLGDLTLRSFELLWPLVRRGGWYVIEDWQVGFPDQWPEFGGSMLQLAQQLLLLLDHPGDVDSIEYRFGQIILRKAG